MLTIAPPTDNGRILTWHLRTGDRWPISTLCAFPALDTAHATHPTAFDGGSDVGLAAVAADF